MTMAAILIGVINCVILAVILVIIGAILQWVLSALGWPIPQNIQKLFLAVVALITLVCFISLLLGSPMFHIIHVSDNAASTIERGIANEGRPAFAG